MKIAVVGSRRIWVDIDRYIPKDITLLISGGAAGVDQLAETWAKEHGVPVQSIRPDYTRYGRAAPLVRNREIVKQAEMVIALWDGTSKGTKYTIDYARKQGVNTRVYLLEIP